MSSTHSSSADHSMETPLTLNSWLKHKKNDLRPEVRITGFTIQAEQSVDNDNFEDAIHYYSKAIELSPESCHLFADRSYAHEMCGQFAAALADAQKAIDLSDEFVAKQEKKRKKEAKDTTDGKEYAKYRNKMMFWRKGRALRALNRFQEAIDALVLSKSLAIKCQFVDNEIRDIKLHVICALGYDRQDVEAIADSLDTIDALVDQLKRNKRLMITNGDDPTVDQLPSNPFKYRGLYVNGLASVLKEEELHQLLESCGEILRCKVYSNSQQSRAIITFSAEQSAREAIRIICSNKHLIRDEVLENLVIRYRKGMIEGIIESTEDPQIGFKSAQIGGECYKWRTTGCDDETCDGLHIPLCHHLDQQSIETEAVKRKREPIVFDINSSVNCGKKVNSSERQVITFDLKDDTDVTETNGLTVASTPASDRSERLYSSRRSHRKSIHFDIDAPKEEDMTLPFSPIRIDGSSDRKFVRLSTSKSGTVDNDLTSTPKVMSSERKRIVFDIKDDEMTTDSVNDTTFTSIKPRHKCSPPITPTAPNDRGVTSYDDLF